LTSSDQSSQDNTRRSGVFLWVQTPPPHPMGADPSALPKFLDLLQHDAHTVWPTAT